MNEKQNIFDGHVLHSNTQQQYIKISFVSKRKFLANMSAQVSAKKTYFQMVKEAIIALKDRTGSSPQAIKAWIMSNYPQLTFAQHNLRFALKKGVSDGKLVKTKNSFKLSAAAKIVKKLKVAKVVEKAVVVKKSPAKKAKTKKTVAGKSKKSAVPKAKKSVVAKAAKKVPAKKIGAKPKTVKVKAIKST